MERSIFAALIGGLLGITALGGLAFVGSAPGSPSALPSRPEGEWRLLDPVVYENISIFPVVSSQGQDTSPFLTLEEGLATGEVTVAEQGAQILQRSRDGRPIYPPQYNTGASVNQLVLINRSRRPLLLLAGELVSGGKQDRVIGKDRIVPVGAPPLPLDVFCVEHGRWTGAAQFAAANTIVHPSVRERPAFDHYWRKLLRSYAVEALTRPTYRQAASRDNAVEFLRRLNGRETQETEPGVYRWREIKEGQLAQIELDALQPKPITLHRLLLHRTS